MGRRESELFRYPIPVSKAFLICITIKCYMHIVKILENMLLFSKRNKCYFGNVEKVESISSKINHV